MQSFLKAVIPHLCFQFPYSRLRGQIVKCTLASRRFAERNADSIYVRRILSLLFMHSLGTTFPLGDTSTTTLRCRSRRSCCIAARRAWPQWSVWAVASVSYRFVSLECAIVFRCKKTPTRQRSFVIEMCERLILYYIVDTHVIDSYTRYNTNREW